MNRQALKAEWDKLSARFAALQQREKAMVAAAVAVAMLMGGQALLVDPVSARIASLKKQIAQNRMDLSKLQAEAIGLSSQIKDPDAPNRNALAEVKKRLAAADGELRKFDGVLVPPARMPGLLQSLLTRYRGIEVASLKTLPPQPLLGPPAGDAKGGAKAPEKAPAAPAKEGAIFKHGIELKLVGGYADLLAYVADIEAMPQKVMLGRMALAARAYPKNELTLTVYTLSLDSAWMVV